MLDLEEIITQTQNDIPHFEAYKADDFGSECHVYLTEETAIKVYYTDISAKNTFERAVKADKLGVGPKVLSELLPCQMTTRSRNYDTLYYITERATPGEEFRKQEDCGDYKELAEEALKIWTGFFGNKFDFCAVNWGVTKEGKVVILDFGPLSSG